MAFATALWWRLYRVLVPKPGADGIAVAGIQTMMTRVPLGTNVGWNIRSGARAPDLCGLNGGFLPFAQTTAQRGEDPRRSLEERYADRNGFVSAARQAANDLVRERFMIPEDADKLIKATEASDAVRNP